MRIVVTGCTSFIGLHLINFLLSEGQQVIGICRNVEKADKWLPKHPNLLVMTIDMEHICQLAGKINCPVDVFIHLAWSGTQHESRNDKELQEKNVKQAINAMMLAKKLKCNLFVEAGSQAEYGYINKELKPETPCHPINEYGKAKLKFAVEANGIAKDAGIKFLHLRILSIYGEGDKDWTMIITCTKKMLQGEDILLSSCRQIWNYLYVKDAVKQIYMLCQYALESNDFESEIYLIGSKDTRPLRSFIEEIYSLTRSKSRLLYGFYTPPNNVELNPDMSKTEKATNGFIADYTFADGMKRVIESLK